MMGLTNYHVENRTLLGIAKSAAMYSTAQKMKSIIASSEAKKLF
jgi:hypothetical protein